MKEFIERLKKEALLAEWDGLDMDDTEKLGAGQIISHNESLQVVFAFELLQTILYRSNYDRLQSADDMQNALEAIHEEIRAVFPDLEESED